MMTSGTSGQQRPVPTWFVDGCNAEQKILQSTSCPSTPMAAALASASASTSASAPTAASVAAGMHHLVPPGKCHCAHSLTHLAGMQRIPVAPAWLMYRDPAADTQLSPSASPSSERSSPLDLSCKSPSHENDGFESDECESPGSILRSLLSPGSGSVSAACTPTGPGAPMVQVEDYDRMHAALTEPDTPVRLARKNIYPVTSRVAHWLEQIVKTALDVPAFGGMTPAEQTFILQHSWHRLLLLCMAQDNFHFAVSASPASGSASASGSTSEAPDGESLSSPGKEDGDQQSVPTMRFAESLQGLIRKMQTFKLNHIQYSLLSTAMLFYTGNIDNLGVLHEERIQEMKRIYADVMSMLRQHIINTAQAQTDIDSFSTPMPNNMSMNANAIATRISGNCCSYGAVKDDGNLLYSKVLRILPNVYTVHKGLVRTLFCSCVGLDADSFVSNALAGRTDGIMAVELKQ